MKLTLENEPNPLPFSAFVAGLGLEFYGAFRGHGATAPNWKIRVLPSRRRSNDLASCLSELQDLLESEVDNANGSHVIGFHSVRTEQEALKKTLTPTTRLIWSDRAHAQTFGTDTFDQRLTQLLLLEGEWRNHVRPPNVRSPLLLPNRIFDAVAPFNEIWSRANDARSLAEIQDTGGRIRRFHDEYYDNGRYTSAASLEFMPPKPTKWHGFHVLWHQNHKYTFRIPNGFHYDVKRSDDARFSLTSVNEGLRSYAAYANVDPYGHTRGGK